MGAVFMKNKTPVLLLKALPKTCIICCNAFFFHLKKENSKQMIGILILSFFLLKALPKTCIICCNAFFYLKKQNSKQKI